MTSNSDLPPEDAKLVTLARATRGRSGAREGAAVRDTDGRTYAAASVDLASLQVSALGGCLVMATAGGSTGLEAAVLLADEPPTDADLAALTEFAGPDLPVHVGDLRGTVTRTRHTGDGSG